MALEGRNIDIINVAGLMMDGENDALQTHLWEMLQPRSITTIAPTPPRHAMEHPQHAIDRTARMLDAQITEIRDRNPNGHVIGVGRSYGGFTLLQAALKSRDRFEQFLRFILIEAPMHPDVTVTIPRLPPINVLAAAFRHYRERARLAAEASSSLEEFGTARVITIGNREDGVVPPEAMSIPGRFQKIELTDRDLDALSSIDPSEGVHVVLPELAPRDDGITRVLPLPYRNHLGWSDEKIHVINDIIETLLRDELARLAA